MNRILSGVRVLDLTRVLSGPFASMLLADMGAEVIKVERPGAGDDSRSFGPFVEGESVYFMSVNRNKRSVTLNLKEERGRELLLGLADVSDVIVENFRPGTMDRLGIGYEVLRQRNKKLVYAAISGFGQTGPLSSRAAYDGIVQAMGGIMSITGDDGGRPLRVGSSIGDIIAGIYCSNGILAALRRRDQTGEGSFVDIAMLDSIVSILENAIARYQVTSIDPGPSGNTHQSIFPFETFPTADGSEIMIAAGNDALWAKLCKAIGREGLTEDPRLATNPMRGQNHGYMYESLCEALGAKGSEEWYGILSDAGVPCSPINKVSQVLANPQVRARDMIQTFDHPVAGKVTVAGNPIRTGGENAYDYRPAPVLGADTEAVLSELLGMSGAEIGSLRQNGIL